MNNFGDFYEEYNGDEFESKRPIDVYQEYEDDYRTVEVEEDEEEVRKQVEEAKQYILEWQEQYGYVYQTEIDGNYFYFKGLSIKDYEKFKIEADSKHHLDELVCEACVIEPLMDFTDDIYAGYTTSLAETILEESLITQRQGQLGLKDIILLEEDALSTNFYKQIPLVIKHCFPEYTLEELEYMSVAEQVGLYTKASWMLQNLEGINMSFYEEEEEV